MWTREHSIETSASAEALWKLFSNVEGWKAWNAGIERITMSAPFAEGSEFLMQPPGQDALTSRLILVRENERFDDETVVGDVRVIVAHRIESLGATRRRVTYACTVEGPDAADIGAAVTADFPEVLAALVQLAER